MSEQEENKTEEQMDEIDRFLASLPSLHIPSNMVEDVYVPPKSGSKRAPVMSVFVLLSWIIFLIALLTAARTLPGYVVAIFGSYPPLWNLQHLFTAMCYLLGNFVLCLGCILICFLKKNKMFSGSVLSLWISGGLSGILALVLLALQ